MIEKSCWANLAIFEFINFGTLTPIVILSQFHTKRVSHVRVHIVILGGGTGRLNKRLVFWYVNFNILGVAFKAAVTIV